MSEPDDKLADEWRIDLEAARWLVRRDRGLTPREQDQYLQWLTADPRHAQWIDRHKQTWADFRPVAPWRPEPSPQPNSDVPAPAARPARRWKIPALLAAAACLILVLGLARFWRGPGPAAAAEPGGQHTLVASAYERRTLPDGSTVELNADTVLELAFTAAERRVTLARGEAHFTVAKNPARPFVVTAREIGVRAVGTAFNVRLDAAEVDVLVTAGRVKLECPPRSSAAASDLATLDARHRAIIPLAPGVTPRFSVVTEAEQARLLDWQPELFEFDSAPLSNVIAQFNRRNRVQLVVAEPDLAAMPIVASFRSDNVEGFVRLLTLSARVDAERKGDTIYLRRKRG